MAAAESIVQLSRFLKLIDYSLRWVLSSIEKELWLEQQQKGCSHFSKFSTFCCPTLYITEHLLHTRLLDAACSSDTLSTLSKVTWLVSLETKRNFEHTFQVHIQIYRESNGNFSRDKWIVWQATFSSLLLLQRHSQACRRNEIWDVAFHYY